MTAEHAASPLPRPVTPTGWAALAGVAVLFAAAFLLVLRFYEAEGGLQVTGSEEAPKGSGLIIRMSPLSIDPETDQFTARFDFDPVSLIGLLDGDDRLTRAMRVTVSSLEGAHEFRYQVGDQLTPQTATLGISGQVASYPFDRYESVTWFAAEEIKIGTDGGTVRVKPIPTHVAPQGTLMNWNTRFNLSPGWSTQDTAIADFDRVFSTRVFALLMLGLMAVLAAVASAMAWLSATNRRRAELGMLTWLAGLLFAFPALRRTMPDAPPIGVTIDVVVFLWTLLVTLIATLLLAWAWGAQSRAALLGEQGPQ